MNILELIKTNGLTVLEIAKELDVATSQIYYWNRNGISENNKHYLKLKKLLPQLEPKATTVKLNGEEDGRYKAGRKPKQLNLFETNVEKPKPLTRTSTFFPRIKIRKKSD